MFILAIILIIIVGAIALYIFGNGRWASMDFWRRQFNSTETREQVAFDLVLGVIMPVLCFILDPIVFQNDLPYGHNLLNPIKVFGYTSIALGIIALSLWLLLGKYLNWASAFLAGIFCCGAVFALLMGIFILPFSVIGLVTLVGVLGLTPFLSSFVFPRNGVRAYKQANEQFTKEVGIQG